MRLSQSPTQAATRTCAECQKLSAAGTCIAKAQPGRMELYASRCCVGFHPFWGSRDERTGRELWPELLNMQLPNPEGDKRGSDSAMLINVDMSGLSTVPEISPTSAIGRARAMLVDMLGDGPREATDILIAAEGANVSGRTMQRAADSLGVLKYKAGFDAGWVWTLP
jgi:hypothetical protein